MESEFPDRIPWETEYYCGFVMLDSPLQCIKCTMCESVFLEEKTEISYHISHLNEVHGITELTHHPQRAFFEEKFLINTVDSTAKCRICEKEIAYNQYGLYLLKNHVEIYHEKSSQNYEIIRVTVGGRDILDKYFIIGNEATCPKCDRKIDMTRSIILPAAKVKELLEHYFSHRWVSEDIPQENIVYMNEVVSDVGREYCKRIKWERCQATLRRAREEKLFCRRTSGLDEITESGRTVLNEPGPSTSSSTAYDRTTRSEQSGVPQNIPKRRKSSTLNETQLKQKKKE